MVICCQDCGIIIYYDDKMKKPVEYVDDLCCPPYVTESGDLFCSRCGPKYDEPDEDECDKCDEYYRGYEEKPASLVVKEASSEVGKQ
jgi:hypothetical protein